MPAKTPHRKWLEKLARESDKLKLQTLREQVRVARAAKRAARQKARETCRAAKAAVRAYAQSERERLKRERVELRAETKRRRDEACGVCVTGREDAKRAGDAGVELARARLIDERSAQATERRWKRKPSTSAPKGAARAREVRQESDDEVRANLGPDELAIWEAVRGRIKPGARMTRTEAFHHWVHEHPGEVALILERRTEREIRELEKAERAARRALSRQSYARASTEDLAQRVRASLAPPASTRGKRGSWQVVSRSSVRMETDLEEARKLAREWSRELGAPAEIFDRGFGGNANVAVATFVDGAETAPLSPARPSTLRALAVPYEGDDRASFAGYVLRLARTLPGKPLSKGADPTRVPLRDIFEAGQRFWWLKEPSDDDSWRAFSRELRAAQALGLLQLVRWDMLPSAAKRWVEARNASTLTGGGPEYQLLVVPEETRAAAVPF